MKFDANGVEAITIGRDEFEAVDGIFDIPDELVKIDQIACHGLTKCKVQEEKKAVEEKKQPGRRR